MTIRNQTLVLWLINVALAGIVAYFHDGLNMTFFLSGAEHNTVLTFIALLQAFRTNQAYDRWWEGRKLWGSLVNSTRNLSSNAASWMQDAERRQSVILHTIVFAWACKATLRKTRLQASEMALLLGPQ